MHQLSHCTNWKRKEVIKGGLSYGWNNKVSTCLVQGICFKRGLLFLVFLVIPSD